MDAQRDYLFIFDILLFLLDLRVETSVLILILNFLLNLLTFSLHFLSCCLWNCFMFAFCVYTLSLASSSGIKSNKALSRRTKKKIGERFPYPTFLFAETKRWGRGNVFARF